MDRPGQELVRRTVRRHPHGEPDQDWLVAEEPLEMRVEGRPLAVTLRTPGHDLDLVAGFLYTEGVIDGPDDLSALAHVDDPRDPRGNTVDCVLSGGVLAHRDAIEKATRELYATSSCGVCGKASIDKLTISAGPLTRRHEPDPSVLLELPERLRAAQSAFQHTGGLHAAGLFSFDGTPEIVREDIGRHNAVDKVLGHRLRADRAPVDDRILLVSSRAGFEIVQKAVWRGFPWWRPWARPAAWRWIWPGRWAWCWSASCGTGATPATPTEPGSGARVSRLRQERTVGRCGTGYAGVMFGVDEDKIDQVQARRTRRRRRIKRLLVTALELIVFLPLLAVLGLVWLLLTPEGLSHVLERASQDADSTVTAQGVAIHPASVWNEPQTWRVVFTGVDMVPKEANRPTIHFDRVVLSMPDVRRLWVLRELHVDQAWLIGMHIQAKQQRAAPKRERKEDALQVLAARTVHVWDASYDAPADDPLPPAGVGGIYGQLNDVVFDPFSREVSGQAALTAQRFYTGTLVLHHIDVDSFEADKGDLVLSGGSLWWEGQHASVYGTILDIDTRARVELTVSLRGARVEQMVQSATGQASPLLGVADVDLVVHSGGELPRGGGYMDAHVELTDAILPLPDGTRGIYKDIVRLAPIAELDDQDRVILESMVGDLTLRRGTVHLHELLYEARIPVVIRGSVDATAMDLYVRFVLGGDPSQNPGRGLRLKGALTSPAVTWATRDELLPGWRELRKERRQERMRRWGLGGGRDGEADAEESDGQ